MQAPAAMQAVTVARAEPVTAGKAGASLLAPLPTWAAPATPLASSRQMPAATATAAAAATGVAPAAAAAGAEKAGSSLTAPAEPAEEDEAQLRARLEATRKELIETVGELAKVEARLQAQIGDDSLPSSDEAAGATSTASTANTGGDANAEAAALQPLFAPRGKVVHITPPGGALVAAAVAALKASPKEGDFANSSREPAVLRASPKGSTSSEIPAPSVTTAFREAVANALRSSRTPSPQGPVSPGQAIPRSARLVRTPATLLLPSGPKGQENSAPWRSAWSTQSLGHSPSSSSLRRRSREGSQGRPGSISPSASRRSLAGSEQLAAQPESPKEESPSSKKAAQVTLRDFIPSSGHVSEEKARPLPVPSAGVDSPHAEEARGSNSSNMVDLQGPPKRSSSAGSTAKRGGRSSSVGKQAAQPRVPVESGSKGRTNNSSNAKGGTWLQPTAAGSTTRAPGSERKESKSPERKPAEAKAAAKRSAGSRMLSAQQLTQREPPRAEQQKRASSPERTSIRASSPHREHQAQRSASPKRTSPRPAASGRAGSIGRRSGSSRDSAAAAAVTPGQAPEVSRKQPEAARLDEEGPELQELALIWSRPAIPSPLLEEEEEGEEDFEQRRLSEAPRERVTPDTRQPSARSGGRKSSRAQNQPARKPGKPWLF